MYNALPIPFFEVNDGWGYYIGQNIQTRAHAHNAVEIVLALDNPFTIHTDNEIAVESRFSVIAANIQHSFLGRDAVYLFIYLDPQLCFAKQLTELLSASRTDILFHEYLHVAATRQKLNNFLQGSENTTLATIIQEFLTSLCPLVKEEKKTDLRIAQATAIIMSSLYEEMKLEKIAAQVYLSPSRFAHLFCQHTGIPFRRYVLWCRIQVALKAVIAGQSLTQASYEAGFADAAHLSRTFMDMFGVSPSSVLKQ
jgi:AraC-like DNA-binding protein